MRMRACTSKSPRQEQRFSDELQTEQQVLADPASLHSGSTDIGVDILLSLQAGHARDILTLEPAAREADCKYIAAAIENERLEKRNQELTEMVMNMERTATQTNRELQQCRAEKQVAVTHQAELFTLRPLVKGANERVAAMMAISVAMRAELTERDELLNLTTHLKTCLQSEVRTLEEHKEDLLMTVAGLTHYMADADRDSVKLKRSRNEALAAWQRTWTVLSQAREMLLAAAQGRSESGAQDPAVDCAEDTVDMSDDYPMEVDEDTAQGTAEQTTDPAVDNTSKTGKMSAQQGCIGTETKVAAATTTQASNEMTAAAHAVLSLLCATKFPHLIETVAANQVAVDKINAKHAKKLEEAADTERKAAKRKAELAARQEAKKQKIGAGWPHMPSLPTRATRAATAQGGRIALGVKGDPRVRRPAERHNA